MEIKIIMCQNPVIPSFSVTALTAFLVKYVRGSEDSEALMKVFFITPGSCLFREKLLLRGGGDFSAGILRGNFTAWASRHHFVGQLLRSQQTG